MDKISVDRINSLHPKVRRFALAAYEEICKALTGRAFCRIDCGLRTFAESTKLYNQGRTTKGPIVTKAKAGQSYHNYGLAIDILLVVDTNGDGKYDTAKWDVKTDFDGDGKADWMEAIDIFKKNGFKWGGDWTTFKDLPHVEMTFGHHWKDLLVLHNANKVDKQGYVLI